ncbi:hypothetical protein FQA39_LY12888 [Lamprigera yunnana]|nr:hypothetical protein FQA39_LY12888 [Lamprigera yunnana]
MESSLKFSRNDENGDIDPAYENLRKGDENNETFIPPSIKYFINYLSVVYDDEQEYFKEENDIRNKDMKEIVVSNYFNTTLEEIEVAINDNLVIYDTPGIQRTNCIANLMSVEDHSIEKEIQKHLNTIEHRTRIFDNITKLLDQHNKSILDYVKLDILRSHYNRGLPGLFNLKHGEETQNIDLIIGGGFIGMEVAENLMLQNIDVTLVEKSTNNPSCIDEEMSKVAEQIVIENGLTIKTNNSVVEFDEKGKTATF